MFTAAGLRGGAGIIAAMLSLLVVFAAMLSSLPVVLCSRPKTAHSPLDSQQIWHRSTRFYGRTLGSTSLIMHVFR